jgi:hypothetical protein
VLDGLEKNILPFEDSTEFMEATSFRRQGDQGTLHVDCGIE